MLRDRDYTLLIDRSGSMARRDQPGGKSRFRAAEESTTALAARCEELDPDGLTLYLFSGRFWRYENVTAERVAQIFTEQEPAGGTDLAGALRHAFDSYFDRRSRRETKWNGETILVVTDGEPDDRVAVVRALIDASRKVQDRKELGVSFLQVGRDPSATRFLRMLDDEITSLGGVDICDFIPLHELEDVPLTDVLMRAITD